MAEVAPDDDSISRFIVRHYRYDPERCERRHVVVAAFDNEREYRSCLEAPRMRSGDDSSKAREHVTGAVHEPGYRRRQQNAKIRQRALAHGVSPSRLQELEPPANVKELTASRPARGLMGTSLRAGLVARPSLARSERCRGPPARRRGRRRCYSV
jgi:hypothetical protein